jgi:cellulose synthase/poly-beta-1,6-N-acetylglucosamine synthase-like glycosyltransferase
MSEAIWSPLAWFNYLVIVYFVLLNGVYFATAVFAFAALRRYALRMKSIDLGDLLGSSGTLPVSLIAPAYNEEATCVEAVNSLLTLNYPDYEVIVCNDGSSDGTLAALTEAFHLVEAVRVPVSSLPTARVRQTYRSRRHANLWVIDKENGGKADALNAGINYCHTPLFCGMDADTLLERDALIRIARPFLEDSSTVAAGGILRIVNGCTVRRGQVVEVRLPNSFLARIQVLEYLRAFLSGRMGWDAIRASLIISGAFGMFRRSTVVAAGGYSTDTVGEDMELVVRLHRHCLEFGIPYRIAFVPDPVAWTECPESLSVLGRQRNRWQRGLVQTLIRHRKMLFNPRYGRPGLIAYPYFVFLEGVGPIVEIVGYVAFAGTILAGWARPLYILAFLTVAILFGLALSVAAVAQEEFTFRRYPRLGDILRLFGIAVLENVGYRQMMSWWRFKGAVTALTNRTGWGAMERKGFQESADRPAPAARSLKPSLTAGATREGMG